METWQMLKDALVNNSAAESRGANRFFSFGFRNIGGLCTATKRSSFSRGSQKGRPDFGDSHKKVARSVSQVGQILDLSFRKNLQAV